MRTVKRNKNHGKGHRWQTTDSCGMVCSWKNMPVISKELNCWVDHTRGGECWLVRESKSPKDWRMTLCKIKD